jgi:hypothetical protein
LRRGGARWPARGRRLRRTLFRRAGDDAFGALDGRFNEDVVGAADQQEMFGIVAPNNDELALAVEIKNVDNVQTLGAVATARRTNAASE